MLTKKQILENLKWRKISDELPEDGSIIEVRYVVLDNNNIFNVYYYTCTYWANYIKTETNILKNIGRFSVCGNPIISDNIEQTQIDGKLDVNEYIIDGFDCFGEEILIDLSKGQKTETDLFYYEWRYIVEDDGNISKWGTVI